VTPDDEKAARMAVRLARFEAFGEAIEIVAGFATSGAAQLIAQRIGELRSAAKPDERRPSKAPLDGDGEQCRACEKYDPNVGDGFNTLPLCAQCAKAHRMGYRCGEEAATSRDDFPNFAPKEIAKLEARGWRRINNPRLEGACPHDAIDVRGSTPACLRCRVPMNGNGAAWSPCSDGARLDVGSYVEVLYGHWIGKRGFVVSRIPGAHTFEVMLGPERRAYSMSELAVVKPGDPPVAPAAPNASTEPRKGG
jgi:hypothetical protein